MILCIGTTPAAQRVMVFRKVSLDEVNRATLTQDGAAGKAVNVSKVLNALGAPVCLLGFMGTGWGDLMRGWLAARGIELELVRVLSPTRQCITVIDETAGTHTELVQESNPVTSDHVAALEKALETRLPSARAVVMSGTLAPGVPQDFYSRCVRLARARGVLTAVDAQGAVLDEALKQQPALVKLNRTELAATLGRTLDNEEDLLAGMKHVRGCGAGSVVVTAGPRATLAFDGQSCWRLTGPNIKAVNPIGSGDSFMAATVWRLLRGETLEQSCRWGMAAGMANAQTLMPGELTLGAVETMARQIRSEVCFC